MPKPSRYSLAVFTNLRKRIRSRPYDGILSFLQTPAFYAEVSSLGLGIPLVVSERSAFPPGGPSYRDSLLLKAHRMADHIVVNSRHHGETLIRNFPWMKARLSIIFNGLDLEMYHAPPTQRGSDGRLKLLAAGRVEKNKNPFGLALALVALKEAGEAIPLIQWAGEQQQSDGATSEKQRTVALLETQGLNEQWEWLGKRDDMVDLFHACDAVIHPSLYEGSSNVICDRPRHVGWI